MKRITCFTESLGGGGAEHQMVILSGMLAEKGYDITLVTYASLSDHYDIPEGVKRLDIGNTRLKGRKMKAIVKAIKVFHFFLWHKTDCIISYRECANLRVLPPLFFRNRNKINVICSDRNYSVRLTLEHKMLLNCLYHRADYIVPNSKTETDFILGLKPELKSKLCTIHNYTDLNFFSKSQLPEDLTVIKIAVFSRYSAQKNPIGFAKAIKVLKETTNHPFEIHWFGEQRGEIDGFNAEYLGMKREVEKCGISDVLKLHPSVKSPTSYMDDYHAVCLPSLYEGFSNSVAEGICCAKPMLVSDVSDNKIMVHDGDNGYLFDPNQSHSICNAFVKFFGLSYEEMCRMSTNSRFIAEQLFDRERFIGQYIRLVERIK